MRYIITSKNEYLGNSTNDIPNPLEVTEIATELIITRLYLINLLNTNQIFNDDTTIVCINDRKCLYTKIFNNVMSYDEFKVLNIHSNQIIDLLEPKLFNQMASGDFTKRIIPYKPFYKNWERDKNEIIKIDYSDISSYDTSKPFVCLVIRKRLAWSEKNMTNEFWLDVIELLKKNNIKTFIFGKETENFADDNLIEFVENYQDWCSIVNNRNCRHIGSTMTGGVYPAMIVGNPNIKLTIIDNTKLMNIHGDDPSFYNDCVNFTKVKFEFINHIPTPFEFYERIRENL